MNFIAPAARSRHALTAATLRFSAYWHGWAISGDSLARELPAVGTVLQLGDQLIPVRLVLQEQMDLSPTLAALQADVAAGPYLEQFIVLMDFAPADFDRHASALQATPGRCITVGTMVDYVAWLQARLGPVARLEHGSPLRQLAERLITTRVGSEPTTKRPPSRVPKNAITRSFIIGRDGVQCFETLFAHALGAAGVTNCEEDRQMQEEGFDLLLRASSAELKTEVKTEDYKSGNISLETYSCFRAKIPYRQIEKQTPGWLLTSSAEILATLLWPSGDLLLADFGKVKEWALGRRPPVPLREGTVKEQRYYSQFYLTNLSMLLREIPESLHLQMGDWMPQLYRAQFTEPSKVEGTARDKTLAPPRIVG